MPKNPVNTHYYTYYKCNLKLIYETLLGKEAMCVFAASFGCCLLLALETKGPSRLAIATAAPMAPIATTSTYKHNLASTDLGIWAGRRWSRLPDVLCEFLDQRPPRAGSPPAPPNRQQPR